jgi:hypothetical protein
MGIDAALCIGFLENLIDELGETDSTFHDRLTDLYLKGALDARQTEGQFACVLAPSYF